MNIVPEVRIADVKLTGTDLIAKNPSGKVPSLTSKNVVDTFVIIILSSIIFITIFSYADCIRSLLDTIIIDKKQVKQLLARIVFSIISTIITLFICIVTYLLYKRSGRF